MIEKSTIIGLQLNNIYENEAKSLSIEGNASIRKYQLLADGGDLEAQCHLADCYENGLGVKKNIEVAITYYQLAANQKHPQAQFKLGYYYAKGLVKNTVNPKSWQIAVYYYQLAADQKNVYAQNNLGICYEHGLGVDKDFKAAVRYYQLASEQNFSVAQNNLGRCYEEGWGTDKNVGEAIRYYQLAAKQRHAGGQYNLGRCYEGGLGVKKDLKRAIRYYQLAAEQQGVGAQPYAQNSLGCCYEKGWGTDKNLGKALYYYQLAAKQGCIEARNNQDSLLNTKSAKKQNILGRCYEKGLDVEKNLGQAAYYYRLATGQKHGGGQYNLGRCYEKGLGVEKNLKKAVHYYDLAANQGQTKAQIKLENLLKTHSYLRHSVHYSFEILEKSPLTFHLKHSHSSDDVPKKETQPKILIEPPLKSSRSSNDILKEKKPSKELKGSPVNRRILKQQYDEKIPESHLVWPENSATNVVNFDKCERKKSKKRKIVASKAFIEKLEFYLEKKNFTFILKRVDEKTLRIQFTAENIVLMDKEIIWKALVELSNLLQGDLATLGLNSSCNLEPNRKEYSLSITGSNYKVVDQVTDLLESVSIRCCGHKTIAWQGLFFKPMIEKSLTVEKTSIISEVTCIIQ